MRAKTTRVMVLSLLLGTCGCTNVKPWQRGGLTDQTMRTDMSPLQVSQMEHTWFSREQANGGRGVGGGGCGCN